MIKLFNNKFSLNFLRVCVLAWEIAKNEYLEINKITYDLADKNILNNVQISNKHLFFAISIFPNSLAFSILSKYKKINKIFDVNLNNRINEDLEFFKHDFSLIKNVFDIKARDLVDNALMVAAGYDHYYVGTEHLLYVILKSDDIDLKNILNNSGIDSVVMAKDVLQILKSISNFSNFANNYPGGFLGSQKTPALDFFSTDLTSKEIEKDVDPVILRDKEIERLIYILSRRYKNNPILLGNAGVGKTAIVEGLAKKIVNNDVPDSLIGKRILKLDLNSIIAGAAYRGEFEVRIKDVIDEASADPNIILFIDEVHSIVGAGSNNGNQDAANILKPALAKGKIRVIGATTFEEYKQYIEKDPALERRFQPIFVNEPNEKETLELLMGIRKNYEKFHNVKIEDEALSYAVNLSKRYITDKYFPDKAIDLIDEASARVKVLNYSNEYIREINKIESKINIYEIERNSFIDKEDFKNALAVKNKEEALVQKLENLRFLNSETSKKKYGVVKREDIAKIVSDLVSVPIETIMSNNINNQIEKLSVGLENNIIGQESVKNNVIHFIKRGIFEASFKNKPLASFVFAGPSGVGKSEVANVIAKNFFGGEENLLRFDMSEFSETISITSLVGAPAGYVGYREGGALTDSVIKKPYSVILFDNADKAHPKVLSLLTEILEHGSVKDATGRTISFKNNIIIISATLDDEDISDKDNLGFDIGDKKDEHGDDQYTKEILKEYFGQELLNKVDKVLVFSNLEEKELLEICKMKLNNLKRFLSSEYSLIYEKSVVDEIIRTVTKDKESNARNIDEVIAENIESKLIDLLIDVDGSGNKTIDIDYKNKKFIVSLK